MMRHMREWFKQLGWLESLRACIWIAVVDTKSFFNCGEMSESVFEAVVVDNDFNVVVRKKC